MPDERALLAAILENPADDGVRLVYADWLDDNGQPDRAEFIRLQCQLAPLDKDDPAREGLEGREAALLAAHRDEWLVDLPAWARKKPTFRRGLVARVDCTVTQFLK